MWRRPGAKPDILSTKMLHTSPAISNLTDVRLRLAAILADLEFVWVIAEGTKKGPDGLTVIVSTKDKQDLALIPTQFEGVPVTIEYDDPPVNA